MLHNSQSDLHFRQVTALLRQRWPLILAIGLLGGGLAVAAGWIMVPKYTAKAQLLHEIDPRDGMIADVAAVDTMVEMLMSPSHLRRLHESLVQEIGAAPRPAAVMAAAESSVEAYPAADLSYESLEEGLSAYKERQSRLVAVTYRTTDPQAAADVANRAATLFLEVEANYQREQRDRAVRSTADRIPGARAELDRAEHALRAHRVQYGLLDPALTDVTDKQIADLNRQLMVARSELESRERLLERAQDRLADAGSGAADASGDGMLTVSATDIEPVPAATISRMTADRDAVSARIHEIEGRLDTLRQASAGSTDSWTRLSELQREADAAGQVYENLLRRHDDLLAQNALRPSARLVTIASVPVWPSSPSPILFVAPAFVASLLAGGMLAVVLHRLDQRLRTEEEVESALDAHCIGLVPKVPRLKAGTLRHLLRDEPFAPYTEAIRGVFLAATRSAAGRTSSKVFLVAGCEGGEGDTTLLTSLAIYAERLGQAVLVMDLDVRNPGLPDLPDDAEESGPMAEGALSALALPGDFVTAASNGIDCAVLRKTGTDPLTLLYGGDFPQTLSGLRDAYDFVFIRSGAVLVANETPLLASMADHVLLTVKWGVTDARTALAAAQQLRMVGADFSVVVNQVKAGSYRPYRHREVGLPAAAT